MHAIATPIPPSRLLSMPCIITYVSTSGYSIQYGSTVSAVTCYAGRESEVVSSCDTEAGDVFFFLLFGVLGKYIHILCSEQQQNESEHPPPAAVASTLLMMFRQVL